MWGCCEGCERVDWVCFTLLVVHRFVPRSQISELVLMVGTILFGIIASSGRQVVLSHDILHRPPDTLLPCWINGVCDRLDDF